MLPMRLAVLRAISMRHARHRSRSRSSECDEIILASHGSKFPSKRSARSPAGPQLRSIGPTITLRISTDTVNYYNDANQEVRWSDQSVDNICVFPAESQSHHGPLDPSRELLIGAPVTETFYFPPRARFRS